MSPIVFTLGMGFRISIDFAGRCLKDAGLEPFGESQHVDGSVDVGLRGLDGIELVMNGGCGTGKVINFIGFDIERKGNVVPDTLEIRMITEWDKIGFCPRVKVVDADHVVSLFQERATQVRSEKSGTSRDENPFAVKVLHARGRKPSRQRRRKKMARWYRRR